MQGQYSNEDMLNMTNIISPIAALKRGKITRRCGNTYNYYCQHSDGSWTNYNCKTKYPH
jgi:hypothetical protein